MDLTKKHCVPCEGGVEPLKRKEIGVFIKRVKNWKLVVKKIQRDFIFKDFASAMKFVNKVAELAESEGHHPDILVYSWNKVRLEIYTHAIGGLHENDFILAAKINKIDSI